MTAPKKIPQDWDKLSVMADYSASGVWFHGACVTDLSSLGISPSLISDFAAWIDRYDGGRLDDARFEFDAFNLTGRELAVRLKRELPNICIRYIFERANDEADESLPVSEEIQ